MTTTNSRGWNSCLALIRNKNTQGTALTTTTNAHLPTTRQVQADLRPHVVPAHLLPSLNTLDIRTLKPHNRSIMKCRILKIP